MPMNRHAAAGIAPKQILCRVRTKSRTLWALAIVMLLRQLTNAYAAEVPAPSASESAVTATAVAPAAFTVTGPEKVSAEEIPQRVAALASPATVGVYCQKDGDRFYGTGVVIDPAGYILTSTTVVPQGATAVEIYFGDHSRTTARVIEISLPVEAALLKIENNQPFPFLPLADYLPRVGQAAYTLGNAGNMIKLGDGASFSAGVVSGLYQVQSVDSQSGYTGLGIETDAAVNDGQDGGPLLDNSGRVLGILSRSFSPARWQGVAVPTRNILAQMQSFKNNKPAPHLAPRLLPTPATPEGTELANVVRKAADALVRLRVERSFPAEEIKRTDWTDYRKKNPGLATLSEEQRNRAIADFFSADSLLAANQMVRRPSAEVAGIIVSPEGHILTSAFNVQSSDPVYLPKGQTNRQLPEYAGELAGLYTRTSDDYTKSANRVVRIMVVLPGGASVPAEVLGFDLPLGVALLKVAGGLNLPYLDLARESAAASAGEPVALLGVMPGTPGYTINTGIVSAAGRNNGVLLQFDALLNYGNSGGPLLNADGKFLGIATAPIIPAPVMGKILPFNAPANDSNALSLSDFSNCPNSGIGMAAVAERIRDSFPKMREGEGISRQDGVTLGFLPSKESAFSPKVVVGQIRKGSPAEAAELKTGDEIISLEGVGVRSWQEILNYLREKQPGEMVVFEVFRALGKPYLFLNGEKLERAADFEKFLENATDSATVSGKVYRPGIKQQIYLRLGEGR